MSMKDVGDRIAAYGNLIEQSYKEQLIERIKNDEKFLLLDFQDIARFSFELGEYLLDQPGEAIREIEIAIAQFTILGDTKIFKARIKNLPNSTYIPIWKIRAKDMSKFITLKGYIRTIADVQHRIIVSKFECRSCGNIINVLHPSSSFKKPTSCGCGAKDKFLLIDKELQDIQKVVIEEDPEAILPTQKPRSLIVLLTSDLCRSELDKTLQPSRKVQITGIIFDKQVKPFENECRKFMEANWIEVIDESIKAITYTNTEINSFKVVAESPTLLEDMAQSIIPNIEGHMIVKQAIFLQLIGSPSLFIDNHLEERGQVHILLVSSPGGGKSQILKRAILFLPGSRFASGGKNASGVGLVAAVTKDEELGGFALSAGIVCLASGALAAIDEMDKLSKEDIGHLNGAMIDMKIKIDKANIHGELEANTAILGAANPKDRVFDKREAVWKQLGLPKDFLDRFDLIFPVQAGTSDEEKTKVANLIVGKYKKTGKNVITPILNKDFVTKYIAYAKTVDPEMNDEVQKYIVNNFINIAKPADENEDSAYFSFRLLTNIIRITSAITRARLSKEITIKDAQKAISILISSLKMQDIITKDNLMNYEMAESITPKPKRDLLYSMKDIIKECCTNNIGAGVADIDEIMRMAEDKLKLDDESVNKILARLKSTGDIIESRYNQYKING